MARRGRPFKVHADLLVLDELIKNNENEKVKTILNTYGIDAYDQNKRTAIISASYYSNIDLIKWLIENNASVNAQDKNGESALHIACQQCNFPIIEILIKADADINLQDCYGRSVLMSMILVGIDNPDITIIEYLLKNNANPYKVNNYGVCAYDVMSQEQRALTKALLSNKSLIEKPNNSIEKDFIINQNLSN